MIVIAIAGQRTEQNITDA